MRKTFLVAIAVVAMLLTACKVTPPDESPGGKSVAVDTAQMVAMKAKSKVEACPKAQTENGGLPAQTLPCLGGGRDVDLSTLKGPLIINFFQGFCTPCVKEMPALEAFYQRYGDQVPVLGIDAVDAVPGVALRQAIHRGVTYPMAADPGGDLQGTSLSLHKVPTSYVLSADGTVTLLQIGGMDSADEVKQLVEQKLGVTL